MIEQESSGGNLTLTDLNRYFEDLKAWLDNARAVQNSQHQAVERELHAQTELRGNVYRQLGYTMHVVPPLWKRDEFMSLLENPQKAMEMSTGLAVLEIVYRAIACAYETYWIYSGEPATPGKLLLGLRVLYITDVVEVDQQSHFLYLYPASPPNLKVSFCRAVVKNILLGVVMFPMCFGMFISKYKRTVYDLLVGTIVVEHRTRFVQQINDN